MRHPRLTAPLLALLTAAALTACTDAGSSAQPTPTTSSTTATIPATSPSPSASASPVKPTKADVLAAYAHFRETSFAVLARGGADPKKDLSSVAFGAQLDRLLDRAADYQRQGIRAVRPAEAKSVKITSLTAASGKKAAQAILRVCVDSTNAEAVDKDGRSISGNTALNFFDELVNMVLLDGRWLVVDESDKPVETC